MRNGNSVRVLLTDVQHLTGEDALWWCPRQRVFVGPAHGEAFSEAGAVIGGPAQRGLEQLAVEVHAGRVTARLDEIRLGAPRGPNANYDADSQSGSFCVGALKNGPKPSTILSRADAVQRVGQLTSEIDAGATFAAKLSSSGRYDETLLPHVSVPQPSDPDAPVWLVEVHGHLHPEFGVGPSATYPWGLYVVSATTDEISSAELSKRSSPSWSALVDAGL